MFDPNVEFGEDENWPFLGTVLVFHDNLLHVLNYFACFLRDWIMSHDLPKSIRGMQLANAS